MSEYIPVNSSHISAVKYEEETKKLYVDFEDTGVYVYSGVQKHTWQAFMDASSKGGFLSRHIKPYHSVEKNGENGN